MHVLARCVASWSPRSAADSAARGAGWVLGLTLVLLTSSPTAAQVTLAWVPSVSMVDGYWLYYGPASGNYTARIDVGPVTTYTVTGLVSGQTYYFAVAAYDRTDGSESVKSNEVSTTLRLSGETGTPVTVTFDNPVPPGSSGEVLNGLFQGIDFGSGQWRWESDAGPAGRNAIYFDSGSGNSRTFTFAPVPRMLVSLRVFTEVAGKLTVRDSLNQTTGQDITPGTMQLVTTGWTLASTTITVHFTAGWELGIDALTYTTP